MPREEKNSSEVAQSHKLSPFQVGAILFFCICLNSDADDLTAQIVSPNYKTRRQAEERLFKLGQNAVPICLKMADGENLASKFCAARVLRKLVSSGLDHNKIVVLKNSSFPELRSIYFSALPDNQEGIKELLSGARALEREVRLASLNRLIELKATFNPDQLLTLLQDATPGDPHRITILSALIETTPSTRWKIVVNHLSDSDPEIVAVAAQLLGRWKVCEAAEKLYRTGINSRSDKVRQASFRALAALGDKGKALILKDFTSDQGHVREQAALASGFFPDTQSQLLDMLERDPYERVAQAASVSLQRLYKNNKPQYFFPYDDSQAARARVVKAWKRLIAETEDK